MRPALKAPGAEPLKPKCDELLSNFAFNCNLRRYTPGALDAAVEAELLHARWAMLGVVGRDILYRCSPRHFALDRR